MAKAVTIARVASRLSTNRSYQPLVLQGLKSFFDGKKRLVKQGDLLAVKVDLNQLQYLQAASTSDGPETGTLGVQERSAPLNISFSRFVGLMYFSGSRITHQAQRRSYTSS